MINTSLIKKKFISNGFQLLKDCLIKERIDLLKDTCEKLLEEKNHQDNSKHDINLGNDRRFLCHQHEKYPELSHFLLGEDIDAGGEITKYNQSASDLDLDKEWRAISLTNMKQFAEMLNANTGIVFEVSRQVENMIVSKINTNLVSAQEELIDARKDGLDYLSDDMKGESSIIEPPFIVAIKEILERVSKREINLLSKKI